MMEQSMSSLSICNSSILGHRNVKVLRSDSGVSSHNGPKLIPEMPTVYQIGPHRPQPPTNVFERGDAQTNDQIDSSPSEIIHMVVSIRSGDNCFTGHEVDGFPLLTYGVGELFGVIRVEDDRFLARKMDSGPNERPGWICKDDFQDYRPLYSSVSFGPT
ncbi:hypothetical protein BJX66DRAFT_314928 [Aspergillus keveii]|uniref:Uncharacterized protein n=1 Tax=Aspergillus keveii TaxID=714993 RepID=A0ABR4FQ80_9EURO